jgi:superfamily II DNA or RNA helicase
MTWQPGERVVARSASHEIVRVTTFTDCEALDLAPEGFGPTRTLLVPFDRPRRVGPARLRVTSRRRLVREVAGALRAAFPYGGLRFCPRPIRLLPYQLEPALAVLRHGALRVLLGDEVGLGKTIEAAMIVNEIVRGGRLSRALILCPASIRHQWKHELTALFDLQVTEADAAWLRRMERDLPGEVNPWSLPGLYLASLDFVKRPEALHALEDVRWDLLAVDEAHAAAPGTDRGAAVHALATRARRLLMLTATPHSGDPEHFAALCETGGGKGSPVVFFRRSREDVTPAAVRPRTALLAIRPTDDERRMQDLLEGYTRRVWIEAQARGDGRGQLVATVLRKRALSSASSLATSLRRRIALLRDQPPPAAQLWLPLEDDELMDADRPGDEDVGGRGLENPAAEAAILASILGAAADAEGRESKVAALVRLLRRVREPAIVFTEYRDTAGHLQQALLAAGHRVCLLHGGMARGLRLEALDRFASGGCLLVATDAASEGLNLHQSCRLIVHFELPWSSSRVRQRAGRVHRIGQTRRVHEIALVADHTCERFVLAPLAARARASAGFAPASLVDQISESRVAAHVLGDSPLPEAGFAPAALPRHVQAVNLRKEAEAEAERLETSRRLNPAGTRPSSRPRRDASIPVGRVPRGWSVPPSAATLLLAVTLHDATGLIVEHQALLMSVEAPQLRWPRTHRGLRTAVGEMLNALRPALSKNIADGVAARLHEINGVRAAAAAALDRREDEMRRELSSTARELVQHGLFDRRALRAAVARARVVASLLDDLPGRPSSDAGPASCGWSFEVRAVLLGAAP